MRPIDRQAMSLVVLTLVIDQVSKQLLLNYLFKAGQIVSVIDGYFRLVVVWNRGVSFGLLGGGLCEQGGFHSAALWWKGRLSTMRNCPPREHVG